MPGPQGRAYRRNHAALKALVMRDGGRCVIPTEGCPGTFDFSLHHLDRWAFCVHHPDPRSAGGSVSDPSNMYPAHRLCNEKWGNRPGIAEPVEPLEPNHSVEWPS